MNQVYFAQVREDARVERKLLERRRGSRVVCIGSGGCTALSLVSCDVDVVYAVDSNVGQCALIELKKAALANLERHACLAFLGEEADDDRLVTYRTLRRALPSYASDYWDAREADVAFGVNQCGATERFYRFVGTTLRNVCPEDVWRRLFACRSIAEQNAFYDEHFATETWWATLRKVFSKKTHLEFFPAFMFEQATEHDFGAFFGEQFELEVRSKPMQSNYFLSQLLFASYIYDQPEGTPHYLDPKGYEATRRRLDKLVVVPKPLEDFLPETKGIDAFFLSNIFDWMSPPLRTRSCELLVGAAGKGARVLHRNMLSANALPRFFTERFVRNDDLSADVMDLERSMMYRRISVGDLS